MWILIERVVLVLGAIVLGRQVSGLVKQGDTINPVKLYSLAEAAKILGISVTDIDHLVANGRLSIR